MDRPMATNLRHVVVLMESDQPLTEEYGPPYSEAYTHDRKVVLLYSGRPLSSTDEANEVRWILLAWTDDGWRPMREPTFTKERAAKRRKAELVAELGCDELSIFVQMITVVPEAGPRKMNLQTIKVQ